MTKFSILGRTKRGSSKMILQNPRLFTDQLSDMDGNIMITVERIEDKGTNLQIWHFRKVVVPLVLKLSAEAGNIMTEEDAELILLHQVCKIPTDKELKDLDKSQMVIVIDYSKRWINEYFGDTRDTSNKII